MNRNRILMALTLLALGAVAPAQGNFESQFYRPIDVARAAKEQYGNTATVTSVGEHLYDWRAVVAKTQMSLDLKRAVADQYGSGWTLVSVGVHLYDWKAVRFADLQYVVLPVMPLASDKFYDIAAVRDGLARYRSVLTGIQNWYALRVGSSFRLLQPLVIPTSRTAAQWNQLSAITANAANRYDLLNAGTSAYAAGGLPQPHAALRVVLSPYAGDYPDVWLGAASTGRFALAPQRATSVVCPATGPFDARCADATYAVGHELGHTFGLGHTCDDYPKNNQCGRSIMHTSKPWDAILFEPEIEKLLRSQFFPGSIRGFGTGCNGSNGVVTHTSIGAPSIGGSQYFRLHNGPRLGAAVLDLGFSDERWGPVLLPWDLSFLGATGCTLYTEPTVMLVVPTDATGYVSLRLQHPNQPAFIGLRFFTQYFAIDRLANRWGITYSNGVATRLGV